jgi:SHAQKYF class myb-like DNA-binding protein
MLEKNNEISLSEIDSKAKVEKTVLFKIENSTDLNLLKKKTLRFETTKKNVKKIKQNEQNAKEGRWTFEEHYHFLEAISKYGSNWKKIEEAMITKARTRLQINSHFQKFFKKLKTCKDTKLGIDFTSKSIVNLEDMIKHIKTVNVNYNVVDIFLYFSKDIRFTKKSENNFIKNESEKFDVFNQTNNADGSSLINNDFINNNPVNNINNNPFTLINYLYNKIISNEIFLLYILNLNINYAANSLIRNVLCNNKIHSNVNPHTNNKNSN